MAAAVSTCFNLLLFIWDNFGTLCLKFEEFHIRLASLNLDIEDVLADVAELFEQWKDHEIDEANLASGDLSGVPITKERHLHSVLPLVITLGKELVKEQIGPGLADIEIPNGGRNVYSVN